MEEAEKRGLVKKNRDWTEIAVISAIAIGAIILVFYVFFSYGLQSNTLSQNELMSGKDIVLSPGENINFKLDGKSSEKHTLTVDEVTEDSATISIESEKTTLKLRIGERKNIDVDKDGREDIQLVLMSIVNGKPQFAIKKIAQPGLA